MTTGRIENQAGYAVITQGLARRALGVAVDAAPHRAREGERRWPMANALPAARVLIGEAADADRDALRGAAGSLVETLAGERGKVTDGFGHARPSYGLLAVHLLGTAARVVDDEEAGALAKQAAMALLEADAGGAVVDPRLAVWRRLIARRYGLHDAEQVPLVSDGASPLVPLGLDDLIDSWTYRELVGLHGLHLCQLLEGDAGVAGRVRSAAAYHLGHTQPDYTTYQPWGLAAFAADPQTAIFAEQQLHDVATHLSIEGAGGAVMPALLLADSAAAMSGTVTKAWRSA